jgi:hypothetical protein
MDVTYVLLLKGQSTERIGNESIGGKRGRKYKYCVV